VPIESTLVRLGAHTYKLAADSALPAGKRGWQRERKKSQPSDPGIQKVAQWRLSGPVGLSREDPAGGALLCDYAEGMDTLYDGLLLPGPARNAIDLASAQPAASALAPYDGFAYDSVAYDSGTSSYIPGAVAFIDEDRGQLFFHDRAYSTQVEPLGMTAVEAVAHSAEVTGAAMWRDRGYLGLGSLDVMQRRALVGPLASTYEDALAGAYAGALVVGTDRIWMVDPEDTTESQLRYSLDAMVTRSNPFPVGDPGIPATGLGTYGRSAIVGSEIGAFGFNDLGQPVRVLESLRGHRSVNNGKWIVTLWGWTYITTDIGLKATIPGQVENAAGPDADRRFEGPSGRITAIWPYKGALFAAALVGSDTYVYRGEFDDGRYGGSTAATGRPAWFPFAFIEAAQVGCIFSTGLRTTPTLLVAESGNGSYWTLSTRERDIADPLYRYRTGTSTWYGTTMMRGAGLHKNPRTFMVQAEDCDASNSYQLAISVDGGAYVDVGDPVEADGHTLLIPAAAGVPLTTVSGHTYKPRLTCTSASTTTPPKLRGTLDMVYDERPTTITEHTFVVELGATRNTPNGAATDYDNLAILFGHSAAAESPIEFSLPGQPGKVYGMCVSVAQVTDRVGDGLQRAQVVLQEWSTTG
jgi:hypothetical protein